MEHVSNEEKARLLCCSDCKNYVCYTNKKRCQALEDLLTMADWKDEQHAKEKQQWIDKACEWWKNEFKTHEMKYKDSKDWYNSKVERFKQAMKGE